VKNNEYDVTVHVWLFSSIQSLHVKGFLQYFVMLRHRCCYGCVAIPWSKRTFWCRELGMVSQNGTTTAVIGRAPIMPLAYTYCVITLRLQVWLQVVADCSHTCFCF